MTRREQIARVIAPDAWEWYDKLPVLHKASFLEQKLGGLEAAGRLIAAGLICEPEADDIRMNAR